MFGKWFNKKDSCSSHVDNLQEAMRGVEDSYNDALSIINEVYIDALKSLRKYEMDFLERIRKEGLSQYDVALELQKLKQNLDKWKKKIKEQNDDSKKTCNKLRDEALEAHNNRMKRNGFPRAIIDRTKCTSAEIIQLYGRSNAK